MFAADHDQWTVPELVQLDGEARWRTDNASGSTQYCNELYYVLRKTLDGQVVKFIFHCASDGRVRPTPRTVRTCEKSMISKTLKELWKGGNPAFGPRDHKSASSSVKPKSRGKSELEMMVEEYSEYHDLEDDDDFSTEDITKNMPWVHLDDQ